MVLKQEEDIKKAYGNIFIRLRQALHQLPTPKKAMTGEAPQGS